MVLNTLLLNAGIIEKAIPFWSNTMLGASDGSCNKYLLGIPFTMLQVNWCSSEDSGRFATGGNSGWSGPVRTFFSITLPYMLFVTGPYLITTFTGNVNNFNVIYLLPIAAEILRL